jgi:uncharacterized membrane protein YedE/YeeE
LIGLLGGIVLGLAARMGRFCTLGAIEDTLYASDTRRLRMWGIAIGTAIIGAHLAMAAGALRGTETLYLSTQWNPLASIIGGLMFGYGMALCGTCGYGALARLGGGDLRALVVVLVMGLSAAFVLSGPLAQARVWAFPIQPTATPQGMGPLLQSTFGITPLLTGLVLGGALCAICLASKPMMRATGHMFWGVVVGLAIVSGWLGTAWITAHGFEALPVESHTFAAPLAGTIFYAMTASGTALSFSVGSVMGVLLGACMGSWTKGQFRWEACEDARELRRQMLGAALMGVGAVLALGCTIGQGISAFSVLAFSAPITFVAIFLGAMFGLRQLITGFAPAR